jgi:hypothetical protein
MTFRRALTSLALAAAVLGGAAVVTPGTAGAVPTGKLTITSAPPTSTNVDVGAAGAGVGDYTTFTAALSDRNGKAVGWLYGTKTIIALPGEAGLPADRALFENLLTFRFTDGSTIVVGGIQTAVLGSTGYNGSADPGERAIIGGTGKYGGARGVLTTTANPDNSRKQSFAFAK